MLNINFDEKTLEELIEIIESPQDYVDEMPHHAKHELRKRNIAKEELEAIAILQYHQRSKELLEGSLFQAKQLELPSSHILPHEKQLEIFKSELGAFMDKRNSLNSGLNYL